VSKGSRNITQHTSCDVHFARYTSASNGITLFSSDICHYDKLALLGVLQVQCTPDSVVISQLWNTSTMNTATCS